MSDLLSLRVVAVHQEAIGIRSFDLEAADGGPLPRFDAGAHVDVHLPGGLVRPYSLCGDPANATRWRIAVLREPNSRGGSVAMHAVQLGQVLAVGAPRLLFALAPQARRHLLLAGGIGVTPLLSMAHVLLSNGADFELHLCCRSVARVPFQDQWRIPGLAQRLRLHLDDGPAHQKLDLAALLVTQPAGSHLYVCGPAGFMEAVSQAARTANWPTSHLHRERFGQVAGASLSGTGGETGFDLHLFRRGLRVHVSAQQTVAQALADSGVAIPLSCEQGICGTCVTRVIEGQPDHRDQFFTDDERARNDRFTPCCSRSHSAVLVLDL